jgi:hypothetical protein
MSHANRFISRRGSRVSSWAGNALTSCIMQLPFSLTYADIIAQRHFLAGQQLRLSYFLVLRGSIIGSILKGFASGGTAKQQRHRKKNDGQSYDSHLKTDTRVAELRHTKLATKSNFTSTGAVRPLLRIQAYEPDEEEPRKTRIRN